MTEVIYYVAISIDGYIATSDGGVDWLAPFNESGEDYGYSEFYESIDAILMGSRTYEQILSFGDWPYESMPCWVFSSRQLDISQPEVHLTNREPKEIVALLTEHGRSRAWLVGGGALASSFRLVGLINEYVVSVIPTVLGAGIPMFTPGSPKKLLKLVEFKQFNSGLVQLRYQENNDA